MPPMPRRSSRTRRRRGSRAAVRHRRRITGTGSRALFPVLPGAEELFPHFRRARRGCRHGRRHLGLPALKRAQAFARACTLAVPVIAAALIAAAASAAGSGDPATPARIEARSADLLAVGLVHDDRMTIHLSRVIDNAPVRDAAVTVVLRGASHPATAETDGSYTLQTKDLTLPGAAVIEFQVVEAAARRSLKGTLQITAASAQAGTKNTARQLWWWVLNFAVCFGFVWLFSRRRKAVQS